MRLKLVRRKSRPRRERIRDLLQHLLVLAVALAAFYLVPVTGRFWNLSALGFFVVLIGLVVMVSRQLTTQARAGSNSSVQLKSLLFLLYPVVAVFALAYYLLFVHNPAEFDGIANRTDALYYTVVTLGTVGFGDVHPVGQLAKILTMVQIVFDLIVIGLLLSIAASRMMSFTQLTVESTDALKAEDAEEASETRVEPSTDA